MAIRPLLLVTIVVAGMSLPNDLTGQERKWQASFGAGPSVPLGELADETDAGFHVQGSVGYALPGLPAGVRLDLFYQDFDAVEREPSINVSYGGEWYRQLSALLNFTIASPTEVGFLKPYGLVGGGWIREWHDDRTYSGKTQSTFNFNAGAGIDFPLFSTTGFIEARFLNLFGGEALPTGPPAVHPEVQFKSLPVTVGVRF